MGKERTVHDTLRHLYTAGLFSELIVTADTHVQKNPTDLEAWNYLAAGLLRAGHTEAALAVTTRIVKTNPLSSRAHLNHGVVLAKLGKLDDAETCLNVARSITPMDEQVLNNIGALNIYQGKKDEAITTLNALLSEKPSYQSAWSNLGIAYTFKEDLLNAIVCFKNATEIQSKNHRVNSLRAESFLGLDRYEDALSYYLSNFNDDTYSYNDYINLAHALNENGLHDDAERFLQRVLEKRPDSTSALTNLCVTYLEKNEPEKAEEVMRRGLDLLETEAPQARLNLALALLGQGKLQEGWSWYNERPIKDALRLPIPLWNGEDLQNKTIVVISDQGVGDEIRWASMLRELAQGAGKVIFVGVQKLHPLIARSLPEISCRDGMLAEAETMKADYHTFLGSLPYWFRPTYDAFVGNHTRLQPDPDKIQSWRDTLRARTSNPTVGICWRSSNLVGKRKCLYTTLDQWGEIFAIPGVTFVNLQYDECEAELVSAEDQHGIEILRWPDVDLKDDLDDAAALTASLDYVISANTSVAELAAALGKPTLLYAPQKSQLAFGLDYVPWYETVELFPFGVSRDPEEMLHAVATRIGELLGPDFNA